jgi:serine/threonine-protein kinase HipA
LAKCLSCYQALDEGEFHQRCAKKIFGAPAVPELPYSRDTMEELAKEIIRRSVAVPGVQAKLSLHLDRGGKGKNGRFTLVGLWGNFILKPPAEDYPGMPEVEDCTMHMAGIFGIPVVSHSLIRLSSGELAYITRRIDRNLKDNRPIHMEDFCQLSGKLTEQKYRGSLEGCAKIIKIWSSNAGLDVITFFEIALFSFLTGNADMHLKNYSLIYNENGLISLAPAYDLLSTRLLIPERLDPEETALPLNGKKRKLTRKDFINFGTTSGLSSKQIENSLKKFQKALPPAAALIEASFIQDDMKSRYQALLLKRAARLGLS